jgi:hypothetical protein
MVKRQHNGSQIYSGFLWLYMIPKFLYLEELIVLRQVMKLTQFAKGINASECPIGIFSYENYQDVCETITSNSVMHFNDTDLISRRKFQKPGSGRWKLMIDCMAMLNKIKIEPQIIKKYTTSSKASLHVTAKSLAFVRNSKNREMFVEQRPGIDKTSQIYIVDTCFSLKDVISNTFTINDKHIKIQFRKSGYERALTVNNVYFDIMGKPLDKKTDFQFHLEIDVYQQSSIQITSNASIITLDNFTSKFDPCQFGNNNNLKELRLICYDPTDLQLHMRVKEALKFEGQWFQLELLWIQLKSHKKTVWSAMIDSLKLLGLHCLINIEVV